METSALRAESCPPSPLDLVVDRGSFVDTICLWLPTLLPKQNFRPLRLALLNAQETRKKRLVLKKRCRPDGSWFFTLFIHQPTMAALSVLAQTLTPFRLIEVHVALDLLAESRADAEQLQRYVEARLLKSGRPTSPIHWIDDQTAYMGRGTRRGVELAMYSDKRSKTPGGGCCLHIEWRLMGAQAIRKAGLESIDAIAGMQHCDFWDQRLSLWQAPSAEALLGARERQLKKFPVAGSTPESTRRLIAMVVRAVSCSRQNILANDLLWLLNRNKDFYRRPAKRLFSREPHAWMLPSQSNALWGTDH